MGEWIKCSERLPSVPEDHVIFESNSYFVTDGVDVGITDFARGHGCGKPWASWSMYGSIPASRITHWQPLPEPPEQE